MTISAPTIDTAHPATVQATTPAITAATTSGMEQQAAQWGTHLASHPVGGWLGGTLLAMLLALAALGLRRAARRPSSPSPGPRLRDEKGVAAMALGVCTLTLALAGAAATVFTTLAASGRAGGPLGAFDDALAAGFGAHADTAVLQFFAAVTHVGDSAVLAVLTVGVTLALWAARQRLLAAGWFIALAGNGLMTVVLKNLFERVRPEHIHGLAQANGFSFPSGHSSASIVAYTLLAFLATRLLPRPWHLPLALLAGALVYTTGWSRVVLQVHYASDVLAGWLLGGTWTVCTVLILQTLARHGRRAPGTHGR